MMSQPEDNATPPSYETIMGNSESTAPMSSVPLTDIPENNNPPPPAYYPPYPNQNWNLNSVTPPWSLDNVTTQNSDLSPPFYKTFLRGKPKALGILIIIAALLEIALGIALAIIAITYTMSSGIPFWGPVFYITAGSLTLTAYQKPSISWIRVSFGVICISCVFSIVAIILNIIDLGAIQCSEFTSNNNNDFIGDNSNTGFNGNTGNSDYLDYDNNNNNNHNHNNHNNPENNHHGRSSYELQCPKLLAGVYAVLSLLLIQNVLIFFATITMAGFGFRSLSEAKSNATQVYVIPNDVAPKKPAALPEFAFVPAQPPPYTANEIRDLPHY